MSPEVGIRAHDLVELARMIAEKGAIVNVEVPGGMLLIVQDVIAGRQKCAAWYAGQALERGSEGRRGGDGHKGFIQILRNVLEILKGLKASASAPCADDEQGTKISGKKKGKRKKDVKLCGMFEDLQLEETGEDSLGDAPAVMIAQAGAAHSTSIKFKL